jgi:WD40 repeat protein
LAAGKDIEEAWAVCEGWVCTVAVSRDDRWVVSGHGGRGVLKACEVKIRIMKTFEGHSQRITCGDISANSRLLASELVSDETARIWKLETGKLVAGPFDCEGWVDAVRFCTDSKKLGLKLTIGNLKHHEVWNIQ